MWKNNSTLLHYLVNNSLSFFLSVSLSLCLTGTFQMIPRQNGRSHLSPLWLPSTWERTPSTWYFPPKRQLLSAISCWRSVPQSSCALHSCLVLFSPYALARQLSSSLTEFLHRLHNIFDSHSRCIPSSPRMCFGPESKWGGNVFLSLGFKSVVKHRDL